MYQIMLLLLHLESLISDAKEATFANNLGPIKK